MKIEDYPPQEPLSEAGQKYGAECLRRGEGLTGEEIAYGDNAYQRLIVFRANEPDGRALLFWPGGGWTSGYKEWMSFMAPAFTRSGVTFVTAGYRLAPQHLFPAGVHDCAAAVRWVHANIARYGGDARKVFVGGHSAGGHYAALLAVKRDWQAALGLPADVVRGCLPLSGVFDFTEGSGLAMRPRFLGPSGNEREASPRAHLHAALPPFFLAHGSDDFPHLIRQAEVFEADVRAAGGAVSREVLAGRNHFSASYAGGEADGPWVGKALAFMARYAG
jgi:acetyl esterase/lipase